jgi:hypothetical protein
MSSFFYGMYYDHIKATKSTCFVGRYGKLSILACQEDFSIVTKELTFLVKSVVVRAKGQDVLFITRAKEW